ncbi:MAG TPA: helix-turn-helix domain-containing protein [Bacteroidales bacterium]|nr:helix-turn-helix domain-containing protein [Bacteroidales bacterium]
MSDKKMSTMTIYIKNMACLHCKDIVKTELDKLGLKNTVINQGEVKILEEVSPFKKEMLNIALKRSGFEIMDPQKAAIVKKIKAIIDDMVYYSEDQMKELLPDYLSRKFNVNYNDLVNMFSEVYNTTIEKYFLITKIERVKELLVYYRLNLTEISYQLNYNNIAHLSNQFKEVTGISPSKFLKIKYIRQSAQQNV